MDSSSSGKVGRNIRALLALGVCLGLVASIGGAAILVLGHARPDVAQPVWKSGQYMMFMGVLNLMIHVGLFFQFKRKNV
jgi:hypothetical protein